MHVTCTSGLWQDVVAESDCPKIQSSPVGEPEFPEFLESCDFGEPGSGSCAERGFGKHHAGVAPGCNAFGFSTAHGVKIDRCRPCGDNSLPRYVVKKLEDAEMPLQLTGSVLPVLRAAEDTFRYSGRNRSCIDGPESE